MLGSIPTPISATAIEIAKIVRLIGNVRGDILVDGDPEPVVFVVVFAGGNE